MFQLNNKKVINKKKVCGSVSRKIKKLFFVFIEISVVFFVQILFVKITTTKIKKRNESL
jgi:hypothetical protein